MRVVAVFGLIGAALGVGVAVILHFVTRLRVPRYQGFFYYPPRYANYLPFGSGRPSWTPAAPLWAVGGLLVGAMVGGALGRSGSLSRARCVSLLAPPAVLGVLIGVAVGAVIRLHDTTTFHGRYVSLDEVGTLAYNQQAFSYARPPGQWLFVLPVGGGLGLLAGVALGALAVLARVRASSSAPA